MPSQSGLILIAKPRGITSFGVVSRLRRMTGVRRIGHAGTLDPFAEGLLPVCLGRATAAMQFMDGYDKTYRLGIAFGSATDTQDLTGEVTDRYTFTAQDLQQLQADDYTALRDAVSRLEGDHLQVPPMYSAVKVNGQPLYKQARQGKVVEREARPVSIRSACLDSINQQGAELEATLVINCSKGTYMRTIADELGRQMGWFAHAKSLVRLQSGPFSLKDATKISTLEAWSEQARSGPLFLDLLRERGILLPMASALEQFKTINLPYDIAWRLICGQRQSYQADLVSAWLEDGPAHCLPDESERLVARSQGKLVGMIRLLTDEQKQVQIKSERVMIDLEDFRQD